MSALADAAAVDCRESSALEEAKSAIAQLRMERNMLLFIYLLLLRLEHRPVGQIMQGLAGSPFVSDELSPGKAIRLVPSSYWA
jgi:hypothetical protein